MQRAAPAGTRVPQLASIESRPIRSSPAPVRIRSYSRVIRTHRHKRWRWRRLTWLSFIGRVKLCVARVKLWVWGLGALVWDGGGVSVWRDGEGEGVCVTVAHH
jgi:hypothetical protein